jgi:hypothetical protein
VSGNASKRCGPGLLEKADTVVVRTSDSRSGETNDKLLRSGAAPIASPQPCPELKA